MQAVAGTEARPLTSGDPSTVANAMLRLLKGPAQGQGLWNYHGHFFAWYGGRWVKRDPEWMEDQLWLGLENLWVNTLEGPRRFRPTIDKVANVQRAMAAKTRLPMSDAPVWLKRGKPCPMPTDRAVTFQDVVLDPVTGTSIDRDEWWFEPNVLPVSYNSKASCGRWMKCLDEWSGMDAEWVDLLQRWFGYCLMAHTRHSRWLLMHGKIRSGKGTISKVLQMLLGEDAFFGTNLQTFSERFGLQGIEDSRVLCIHEVNKIDGKAGESCVERMKSIVGQDPISLDRKYLPPLRNVRVNAKIMLQANEIPELPNKGSGLSSKMLVLPFEHSFLNREDPDLVEKLRKELEGIAAWAVEGAKKVETSEGVRFPMPSGALETVEDYHMVNNPLDQFLGDRFVQNPKGSVVFSLVYKEWLDWSKRNDTGMRIPKNKLTSKLTQESTWDIRGRRDSKGARRVVVGLSLRRTHLDEE